MAALRFDDPAHLSKLSAWKSAALRARPRPNPLPTPRAGGPQTCNVQLAGNGGGDGQAPGGRAQTAFGVVRDLPVALLGVHLHELARLSAGSVAAGARDRKMQYASGDGEHTHPGDCASAIIFRIGCRRARPLVGLCVIVSHTASIFHQVSVARTWA